MIALPEWLEEKATDAPTMVRVMIDASNANRGAIIPTRS